jgi:3-hydroxyacyl-[acyl-carrier-protein] dehydratase
MGLVTSPLRRLGSSTVAFLVDPAEPVFAGHFPEFPVFPGVCVLECVRLAAIDLTPARELAAVESARLTNPVLAGDELLIDLVWDRVDTFWLCTAEVRTEWNAVATVRLRMS